MTHPLRRLLGELASVAAVERVAVPPLSLAGGARARVRRTRPTGTPSTRSRAGTRSLLPSCLHRVAKRCRRRCATRCSRASRGSRPRRELCSRVSRSCLRGAELWLLDAAFQEVADRVDECVAAGVLRSRRPAPSRSVTSWRASPSRARLPPRRRRDLHAAILRALKPRAGRRGQLAAGAPRRGGGRPGGGAAARSCRRRTRLHGRARTARPRRSTRGSCATRTARRPPSVPTCSWRTRSRPQASGDVRGSRSPRCKGAIDLRRSLGDRLRAGDHLARLTVPTSPWAATRRPRRQAAPPSRSLETLPASAELATAYGFRAYAQHGQARQRRRRALGPEGGRRSRGGWTSPRPSRSGSRDGRRVRDGRGHRRGVGLLEQASRSRGHTRSSIASPTGTGCSAGVSRRCTSSTRAERCAARPHRVRRGARPGLDVHARVARAGARVPRALGETAARSPRKCSPRPPPR